MIKGGNINSEVERLLVDAGPLGFARVLAAILAHMFAPGEGIDT